MMRRGLAAVAALCVGVTLAGCGQDGPPRSAAEISAESRFNATYTDSPTVTSSATSSASGTAPPSGAVLFIGDSYTAGTGAPSPQQAESCLTAKALGLVCELDAEGGTGFIANGQSVSAENTPLLARLAKDKATYTPTYIVVDAGRNDHTDTSAAVEAAASSYFTALRADFPNAKIAIVDPYYMTSDGQLFDSTWLPFLTQQASEHHFAGVVDPIAEGWISASASSSATLSNDTGLTAAGHVYIAAHLAPDLRRLGF